MVAEPREFNGKGHNPLKAVLRLRTLVIGRCSKLEQKRGQGTGADFDLLVLYEDNTILRLL